MSSIIRSRLNQQLNLPQRYSDFIRIVQQLAGRSFSYSTVQPSGNGNNQRGSEPMDIGAITINSIDVPTPRSTSPRARSISPARRNRYRYEGRCVQCGSFSHWVKNCPLQLYSSSLWPHKKQTGKRTPASDQESDKSDIDEEIGQLQRGEI